MRRNFIIVGRAVALALTLSLLVALLAILAEDGHAPTTMANAPSPVTVH
jgi:hypothetical protein